MIARCLVPIVACFSIAAAGAESAGESPQIHAARYFAAGLEQPLLEMRKGAQLLLICTARLRKACSREQRQLAASSRTIALLDELTLFPQRPTADPAAGVTQAADLKARIAAVSTELTRTAYDYDRRLLARYGAVLRTCPGETDAAHRASLEALTVVDLQAFQGLEGADYERARQELAGAEAQATETLRAMPAEDCRAALVAGQLLMELLNGKVQPWTREERRVGNIDREYDFTAAIRPKRDDAPTREVAASIAGNFVTVVATELQLMVHPESAARIKAIADGAGPSP